MFDYSDSLSSKDLELVQSSFPNSISEFSCTYLVILLSVRKLPKAALQPLVDKVSHRLLPWKGRLTTLVGRSVLVLPVLSSNPVHVSMVIGLLGWVIKAIDKKHRAFLWTGTDSIHGGGSALCPGRMSAALELSADLLFLICECQVSLYAFAGFGFSAQVIPTGLT